MPSFNELPDRSRVWSGRQRGLRRRRFVYSSASDRDFDPDLLSHGILAPRLFKLGVRCADEIVVQTEVQAEMCRARVASRAFRDSVYRGTCTTARDRSGQVPMDRKD